LRDDAAAFAAANGRGLPTLWIGSHELAGAQTVEDLTRVLDAALSGS
jgi:predicted DsbA family dithiol-disulfide isomerase